MSIPKCLKLGSQANLAKAWTYWWKNFLAIGQSLILPTWRMIWMKQMQTTILFLQSMWKMTLFHYFMKLVSKETQNCVSNLLKESKCFVMFHNLTTPKHNTKVATPISPIHAACATIPKHRNPTINVVQTSPYGIPFNLGTYDVSPNVSPTTNHTHCSPKTLPI